MPRDQHKRGAAGAGGIHKKNVIRNGKTYTYWEARITTGYDPGTGKQIQRFITGKNQKEVREKLQAIAVELNEGTYQTPTKQTVSEWLDVWASEYLESVKPRTKDSYICNIKRYIKPAFGASKLQNLKPLDIQRFYNELFRSGLSAKTVRNIHGCFHKALQVAVELGYLKSNPAANCKLPRKEKPDIKPLDVDAIADFIQAIQGHRFENVYLVSLYTGMREGEVLGLTWDVIDFQAGTIVIKQQLQKARDGTGRYQLISPKNGKSRKITPAPSVMTVLKNERAKQAANKARAGSSWDNPLNLVFTNEEGHNLSAQTVYLHFKKIAAAIGHLDTRLHDLRHTYAVISIQNGDDIKTVQENLGHHTAAFTLDTYAHVTNQMQQASAAHMEAFIQSISST